jgi:ABC-type glucose/galactose transport system permease subunit
MLPRSSSLTLGHTILTTITVPKVLSERKLRRINIQRSVAVTSRIVSSSLSQSKQYVELFSPDLRKISQHIPVVALAVLLVSSGVVAKEVQGCVVRFAHYVLPLWQVSVRSSDLFK